MMMNFHCETAREVPLKELRSRQDLDPLSWQENFSANYIYIYIYIYIFFFFFFFELTRLEIQRCSPKLVGSEGYTTLC